jgi:hypothetical protein
MAELNRAMQAAVETPDRDDGSLRGRGQDRRRRDPGQRVDRGHRIRTGPTATSPIRDWSKAEIARVREETETRIAARKAALEDELVEHTAAIETRTARIAGVVATYEADLAAFFERLNAEEDPTRIATMAEAMPEPPARHTPRRLQSERAIAEPSEPSAGPSEPSPGDLRGCSRRLMSRLLQKPSTSPPRRTPRSAATRGRRRPPGSDAAPVRPFHEEAVADIDVASAESGTTESSCPAW